MIFKKFRRKLGNIKKTDLILSSFLFLVFFYFFVFPFLIKKINQFRVLDIVYENTNEDKKVGLSIYKKEKTSSGGILISTLGGHLDADRHLNKTILINNEGEIVNEWRIAGWPAKLLPDGNVIGNDSYQSIDKESNHQEAGAVVELSWRGDQLWKFNNLELVSSSNIYSARSHHSIDIDWLPSAYNSEGIILATSSRKTLILSHQTSYNKNINPEPLEDDVLVEVDQNGSILWKWVASDHFEEFGFTDEIKKAIYNTKLIKNKLLDSLNYPNKTVDWLHINHASYLGPNIWYDKGDNRFSPDNIIISSRNACFMAIIEKETGKIVWQIGPDYGGKAKDAVGQIIGQHATYMIPKSLPGEGNIIIFDNGGFSCYGEILGIPTFPAKFRKYSRVIEIDPINLEIVWEYKQSERRDKEKKFFSWNMGSAQRLPNGNTLITESATGRIFEVTNEKEIVWEYFSYFQDEPAFKKMNLGNWVYQAYRYPDSWIASGKKQEN